jgi:hypothetical protein
MKLYKFKLSDVAVLVVLFILGYLYTEFQHYLFSSPTVRVYSYLAMVAVMYSLIFALIAPKEPMELANSLAVIFGVIVLAIIIVQDFMILHIVSWRTPIVFLAVVIIPYLAAWMYKKARK